MNTEKILIDEGREMDDLDIHGDIKHIIGEKTSKEYNTMKFSQQKNYLNKLRKLILSTPERKYRYDSRLNRKLFKNY